MLFRFCLKVSIFVCASLSTAHAGHFFKSHSQPLRTHALPKEHIEDETDSYLEGYIQALVDVHFYEYNVSIAVVKHKVYLYNLPKNALIANSIISFIKDLPEVDIVGVEEAAGEDKNGKEVKHTKRKQVRGIWFPQSTMLFQPLLADLREPFYSVGYRGGDEAIGKRVIGISLGDTFPIFRWRDVGRWHGDIQFGIVAGIWSVFSMHHNGPTDKEISELITTDYLVGFPLTYAFDRWAFRLRPYHVSSHLGDEFLVNHPNYPRKNPSMEAVDLLSSCQLADTLRVYGGPGWIFHSDPTYPLRPLYFTWGGEWRLLGSKSDYHNLYGTPFIAMNLRHAEEHHWKVDGTYLIGYEWSRLQGVGRKVRIFGEYHHGYSEGQFHQEKSSYGGIRMSYGF